MPDIWTKGHWTCPEATFMHLLSEQDIEVLADVGAHPGATHRSAVRAEG